MTEMIMLVLLLIDYQIYSMNTGLSSSFHIHPTFNSAAVLFWHSEIAKLYSPLLTGNFRVSSEN